MGRKFSRKDICGMYGLIVIAVVCICITPLLEGRSQKVMLPVNQKVVVLDAGHGGWDPGKTGRVGEDEKILNLAIMVKLQQYLEQGGATVLVTRATDEALGSRKVSDMAERQKIANESDGDILISIHQNAFPSSSERGAQVFYYKSSEDGKRLAELIQESLKANVDGDNKRKAKQNQDYYILRTTQIPSVIVECGFLSNSHEESLLNDDAYQDKIAWGMYLGIIEYFSTQGSV
ncbi:MAG: N-acetylmuramoyl-L-alanine amidase [Anaerotignum sp.]